MNYPPLMSDEQLNNLAFDASDWQLNHGSLLKVIDRAREDLVVAKPVGVTLFPTLFPRVLFNEALALQETYNKLYTAIAEDEDWLQTTLRALIETDLLADVLWGIHLEVKEEGYVQAISLGIFRSDYMLHVQPAVPGGSRQDIQIKQVEFNTISCAGGVHGNKVSDMHRYLHRTGSHSPQKLSTRPVGLSMSNYPLNHTITSLISALSAAHEEYGASRSSNVSQTCTVFIVQPNNFNIADERPIEYALWGQSPPIPTYRIMFGQDVLESLSLTPTRELLYLPPNRPSSDPPLEVSVIYLRAGFEVIEYDEVGRACRLLLERSRAIKCPSILSHLTTFKKVQQELTMPETLERYLSVEEAAKIAKTFAPILPMDESHLGLRARELAMNPRAAKGYILKPSLEGGGHNVYGVDIPKFINEIPPESFSSYILMEKITSPLLYNILVSPRGTHEGPVISELGVFGFCLWKRNESRHPSDGGLHEKAEIVRDLKPSWSFKTKSANVNEMSVVKGYGCFDSPALVDRETFANHCRQNTQGKSSE